MKRGQDGGIPDNDFKVLLMAYESYICIKKISSGTGENTHSILAKHGNNAMNTKAMQTASFRS